MFSAVVLAAAVCWGAAAQSASNDGLKLLDQVAEHYAQAKTVHIEAVQEVRTTVEDFASSYQKALLTAYETEGKRYRYDGTDSVGSGVVVSDGKTQWELHRTQGEYVEVPGGLFPHMRVPLEGDLYSEEQAWQLREGLNRLGALLTSATREEDQTIEIDGKKYQCAVVSYRNEDNRRTSPGNEASGRYWIELPAMVVRKSEARYRTDGRTYGSRNPPVRPNVRETVTTMTYRVVELDGVVDDAVFHFVPDSSDTKIAEFKGMNPVTRSSSTSQDGERIVGIGVPDLTLHAADGSTLSLKSLRGTPVLIDMWATWCVPCLDEMPWISKLQRQLGGAGLVVVGIDSDADPKTAQPYLDRKDFAWKTYHQDKAAALAFPNNGIPHHVLIDADGRVVYAHTGGGDEGLLRAIRELGPSYSNIPGP
jgi:thiol-disulfide isomerase/thioredoxin